jgi:hypothetical protein
LSVAAPHSGLYLQPGQMEDAIRNELAAELSRRQLLQRAGGLGLGALILSAVPVAERMASPDRAAAAVNNADATLQAFFDTIIPGRKVAKTDLGNEIHPQAIAGVDPEPGGVEADALLLAHNSKIGFDALEPGFLAELESFAASQGGQFLDLSYSKRVATCIQGLDFGNPSRVVWEAAAAIPFTAFCAAATQRNATSRTACGYRVMGHPGTAPHGYRDFSYFRQLNRGRTKRGYLP